MSTFRVEICEIKEILPHSNADRLELAKVFDWTVVVQKGVYKLGDKVVYVPVDSILSQDLENLLFSPDSKIKLKKSRVRSIKIRGEVSQGMIIGLSELDFLSPFSEIGTDVADILGITKYEPPSTSSLRI